MLNALTVRERRLLLGILAMLLLGAMVKLWRWRAMGESDLKEPVEQRQAFSGEGD
jgi:hypothetical protein